jgi:hypothetical protein
MPNPDRLGDASGGDGLLLIWTDVAPDAETEFDQWYDRERLAQLRTMEGVVDVRRYQAIDGRPRHLTVFEIADPELLQTAPYLHLREDPVPWTAGPRRFLRSAVVDSYRKIFEHGRTPLQPRVSSCWLA